MAGRRGAWAGEVCATLPVAATRRDNGRVLRSMLRRMMARCATHAALSYGNAFNENENLGVAKPSHPKFRMTESTGDKGPTSS